jgi:threonine/homoserine/homoserine lactone efflux protein
MSFLVGNSAWKVLLLAVFLLLFFLVGLSCVFSPDRFMSEALRGGEELTGWSRLQLRIVGAIFAGFAMYLLYALLRN